MSTLLAVTETLRNPELESPSGSDEINMLNHQEDLSYGWLYGSMLHMLLTMVWFLSLRLLRR